MEPFHLRILDERIEEIRRVLDPVQVFPSFIKEGIMSEEDIEKIRAQNTRRDKVDVFINVLKRSNQSAFDVFVKALEKVHVHLACLLLQSEKTEMEVKRSRLDYFRVMSTKEESDKREILKAELEKTKLQKEEAGDLAKRKEKEITAIKKKLETATKEKEKLDKKLSDAIRVKELRQKNLKEITNQKNKLFEEKNEIVEKYTKLKHDHEMSSTQLLEIQRQPSSHDTTASSAEELEAVKKKVTTIENEKKKLEKDLSDEKKEKVQRQKDLMEAKNQNRKLSNEKRELEEKCTQLQNRYGTASTQLSEIQRQPRSHDTTASSAEEMGATSRSIPKARVFSYSSDFDEKGIIYALGTDFGRNTHWVNPGGKRAPHPIPVTRSSDGEGKAKHLFKYEKERISSTIGQTGSWWCLDLGEKYSLFLTHYTLRHGRDDNKSYLYNWDLQGSHDGENWEAVLDSQRNHKWLDTPIKYMTKTWPIEGEVEAFRFFRIFQMGPNSSGLRFDIYLSGMELYGVLLDKSRLLSQI